MSMPARILPLIAASLLLAARPAPAETAPAPAPAEEIPALPPTRAGRQVVLDSSMMLRPAGERVKTLSDFDAETADIVREINRKPGTWQLYLLYTAEDLPERMFHPGFAIRLPARKVPVPPEAPADAGTATPASEPIATPPAEPAPR